MDIPKFFNPLSEDVTAKYDFRNFLVALSKQLVSTLCWFGDYHTDHRGRTVNDWCHIDEGRDYTSGHIVLWKPGTPYGVRITFTVVEDEAATEEAAPAFILRLVDNFTLQVVEFDADKKKLRRKVPRLPRGVLIFHTLLRAHLSNDTSIARNIESIILKCEQYEESDTRETSTNPPLPEYDFVEMDTF